MFPLILPIFVRSSGSVPASKGTPFERVIVLLSIVAVIAGAWAGVHYQPEFLPIRSGDSVLVIECIAGFLAGALATLAVMILIMLGYLIAFVLGI